MDIYAEFHARISVLLRQISESGRLPAGLDLNRFLVEPPREASHGDLAANAAMVYGKEAKAAFANPRQLALEIASALAEDPQVAGAEVAGPGFINIRLRPSVWSLILRDALLQGACFGQAAKNNETKINIEYVSANPTGPMHVGHGRGAIFGDTLASLLEFAGYQVTREYYINDAGAQVDVLARSTYLRYREALGEDIGTIPDGLYPGDYLKPIGERIAALYGKQFLHVSEPEWLETFRTQAVDGMMDLIRTDLAALNISHEVFFSERSLTRSESGDQVASAIETLGGKGLVYSGRLPPPKGQTSEEWEDREQILFKSTEFGDDIDRALMKSDGSYTYFASDIAYHKTKIDRGFAVLIDIWGADHGGYVKRMQAAVKALSEETVELDVKLCQLVKLMRGGEPVKMSKRSGDFVTLREVVDEVGLDAVRFMMIFRKNDATLEFDLAKVIEQSKDNPVFYVQYAHARAKSALRQAMSVFPQIELSAQALAEADFSLLKDQGEIDLVKLIAQFPRIVRAAALAHEPHRVAFYLHDMASCLHAQWSRGKDQPDLRFVNEAGLNLTLARLGLVSVVAAILESGLKILGVGAPEEMR